MDMMIQRNTSIASLKRSHLVAVPPPLSPHPQRLRPKVRRERLDELVQFEARSRRRHSGPSLKRCKKQPKRATGRPGQKV